MYRLGRCSHTVLPIFFWTIIELFLATRFDTVTASVSRQIHKEPMMFVRFWMIVIVVMVLTTPVSSDEITIASWNIEVFGKTKAGIKKTENPNRDHRKNETLNKIVTVITEIQEGNIDLIAIQEVRDKDSDTLSKLSKSLGDSWTYIKSGNNRHGAICYIF